MVRLTLIDFNFDEFHYYLFIISLDSCYGSCNTIEDPFGPYHEKQTFCFLWLWFGRICVPNKIEEVNWKEFSIIKEINESKTWIKHISCNCRCKFDSRKCNSKQKWNKGNQ